MHPLFQVVGQVDPTGGWSDIVATYGPFAPFAALLLWLVQLLWKDNKAKEEEIRRLTEAAMDKVLPVVLDATKVIADANEAVMAANLRGEDLADIRTHMKDLAEKMDDAIRALRRAGDGL